jgi:hypothetical protein
MEVTIWEGGQQKRKKKKKKFEAEKSSALCADYQMLLFLNPEFQIRYIF